jgi:hypothetical protein
MRISMIAWLASTAILTSGAMLAALAQGFNQGPRDRCTASFPIEPRELYDKATDPPTRQIDILI